jgi:ribose transport system substrate-binding protein
VFFTNPRQPNLQERLKGYQDVFGRFPGLKVVEVFDMQGDAGKAMAQATEYAKRTGPSHIDGYVCLEAGAGKGVAEALSYSPVPGRREIVTMDADPGILSLVEQGSVDATIGQKPYTMAFLGLDALDQIHHDPPKPLAVDGADTRSPYPAFVDTGVTLVDKGNVGAMTRGH